MSDGTDDTNTRVSGSLGTMGVDSAGDGAGNPTGDVGSGVPLPTVSYAFVRCDGPHDTHSLYEIIEVRIGRSDRVIATRIRYPDAVELTQAMNIYARSKK
jgi:hypothetical protein